jgi:hypothetical protein
MGAVELNAVLILTSQAQTIANAVTVTLHN